MVTEQKKQLSGAVIERLEHQIPDMAAKATRLAYYRAVAAGQINLALWKFS
ncbi:MULTISPECIES: hypothetical protein [Pseudomonas]|uniref:hypothetical protein n=1 Tax=Pseudomonas mosselii TaxID=78327 RepID=UPI0014875E3F|nr:hypothetical protein [Pseudomonas mosselii]